jgi:putative ABC transport system permease protein
MGSGYKELVFYSIIESTVLCLIAALAGCSAIYLAFPYFEEMIGVKNVLSTRSIFIGMGVLACITGILSGFYPAFVLSSLAPLNVLKSNKTVSMARGFQRFSFRKILVTTQFAICILLIGSAFIARHQFVFLNEKNLGLKKDQVVAITDIPDPVKNRFKSFKDELSKKPGIKGVTACLEVPSREIRDGGNVSYDGMVGSEEDAPSMDIQVVDHDFFDVMGLEFLAGGPLPEIPGYGPIPELNGQEDILKYFSSTPRAYVINETAMKKMGWKNPKEAVGKSMSWGNMYQLQRGPIVGVVRDFHQESLRNTVDPVVMVFEPVWLKTFLIKLPAADIGTSIAEIRKTWNNMFPQYPFEYSFVDDLYERLYKNERRQLEMLYALSGVAIFIAFLGLFGLVAYSLKTRTKEIAVRKIFGADYLRLVGLLSREYLMVVVTASVISIPVSIYLVSRWLENYAYRIDISWGSYLVTLMLIGFILIGTIAFHTFRSSRVNPTNSLREN